MEGLPRLSSKVASQLLKVLPGQRVPFVIDDDGCDHEVARGTPGDTAISRLIDVDPEKDLASLRTIPQAFRMDQGRHNPPISAGATRRAASGNPYDHPSGNIRPVPDG